MRIAIDASSVPRQPAGAGVYAIELASAMARRNHRDGYALFADRRWARAIVHGKPNWRAEHIDARSGLRHLAWEQFRLPRDTNRLGIDVLHSTHHTLPLLPMGAKRVVTIHDLTFFRLPERYPPTRRLYMQVLTRLAAGVADAIVVPSNAVRDDLERLLGVLRRKTRTIYEAAGAEYGPVAAVEAAAVAKRYGITCPYVLSVGSLEPGKNRGRLIGAMRQLRDEGIDYPLVVVGQRAWSYEEDLALVERLGMQDRTRFLGYVPRSDLPALYSGATVFAFPSLYEGFGLPVIEAMTCGVPVLTSNLSATLEVAGEAAFLVDPLVVGAICDGLRRLLTDADLRSHLSEVALKRASEFSWERAAHETHEVYESVFRQCPTPT